MGHRFLHGEITDRILKCAVGVHTEVGPGLPELSYQSAMRIAMSGEGLAFVEEPTLEMKFRGTSIGRHKPDFIVENRVVLELKAVKQFEACAATQMLTYLRASGMRVGLLVNFNAPIIPLGVKRFVL